MRTGVVGACRAYGMLYRVSTTVYPTKTAARAALYADGYRPGAPPLGAPLPWVKLDRRPAYPSKLDPAEYPTVDRLAIFGNDAVGWRIVPYPDWLE